MASTIGKVRAVFTASSSGLTAGVNQASASMKRLERDVRGLRGGLSTLTAISGTQLFGQIASGAMSAARSLVGMASASMDAIGNQRDLAARLGLTYGELSGLTLAGEQVGVSMEAIGGAVTRAEVAFTKAASGSQTAVAAFQRIGLSVDELNGLSAAERFQAIAEAIKQLPTAAERSAAAVGLFGRAGAQLLPMFEMGAAGIQQATEQADRLGLNLNSIQTAQVDRMGDAFVEAKKAVEGVVGQIVARLAPSVTAVTEAFTTLISGVGGQNIGAAIGEAILGGARYLAQVADFLIANVGPAFQYVSQVAGQWNAVWEFGGRVASFFSGIGSLLVSAMQLATAGVTKVFGFVVSNLADLIAQVPGMGGIAERIAAIGQNLNDTAAGAWEAAGQSFVNAGTQFEQALGDSAANAGEAIAGPVTQAFDEARAAARNALGQVDVAAKQTVEIQNPEAVGQAVQQALNGIDSRTTEGMKEYFRILRGDAGDNVQQQQLQVMQEIADNTAEPAFEMDIFDLAPAAGG